MNPKQVPAADAKALDTIVGARVQGILQWESQCVNTWMPFLTSLGSLHHCQANVERAWVLCTFLLSDKV